MGDIRKSADGFEVDARLLISAFDLSESELKTQMRGGRITSLSEKGLGRDLGRWRITFYAGAKALRLTVDSEGNLLSKTTSVCA